MRSDFSLDSSPKSQQWQNIKNPSDDPTNHSHHAKGGQCCTPRARKSGCKVFKDLSTVLRIIF